MEQLWTVKAGTPLPCEETYMGTSSFSERETQVSTPDSLTGIKKADFLIVQWEVITGENRPMTYKEAEEKFWSGFWEVSEFVSFFIEASNIFVFNIFSNNATKKLKKNTGTYR